MKIKGALAALAFAVASFGLAACGDEPDPDTAPAEAGAAAPGAEMDPEMMELMVEAQQIQQRLAPIQQEAMQDEALSGQLEDLQERVEAAMREENPELLERMEGLEAEFMAAQESGDEERVQQVGMEAQGLQMELQGLQASVLERPDLRESVDAFEEAQRARMIEIDPEAAGLLDRIDEIIEAMGLN